MDTSQRWPLPDVDPTKGVLANLMALSDAWRDALDVRDLDAMTVDHSPVAEAERGVRAAHLGSIEDALRFAVLLAVALDIDPDAIEATGIDSWDLSALGLRHTCDCGSGGCDDPECDYAEWAESITRLSTTLSAD
jgi:hypothetical protein